MNTGQIWKQTSVVMFLTAVAVWSFWQIFDPPSASTVFLRVEQGEPVLYQLPFLNLGFSRLWPDLIGWPLLIGVITAVISWERKLIPETLQSSLPGKLDWILLFILLFFGISYGLAWTIFLGVLFGATVVIDTKKDYPGERLFNVTAWIISLTLVSVPVATTVNGLAGVIFLFSLFLGGALIAGLLFGAWYSFKFLASLRPKVEERNPTIGSRQ